MEIVYSKEVVTIIMANLYFLCFSYYWDPCLFNVKSVVEVFVFGLVCCPTSAFLNSRFNSNKSH